MRECAGWGEALDLQIKEHIALVGGGGKTTTMWSLARELCSQRPTVVASTTKAGPVPAGVPLVLWHKGMANAALGAALKTARGAESNAGQRLPQLIALGNQDHPNRVQAVAPATLDFVFTAWNAHVINEADGARMKPFKAPAAHEPVLARTTTLAIIVIGRDAIGAAIAADHLHRPELIVQFTGAQMGEALTGLHIVAIVRSYVERMVGQAPGLRCAILINKVDGGPNELVRDLAAQLETLNLAAIVAASQLGTVRRWRLR